MFPFEMVRNWNSYVTLFWCFCITLSEFLLLLLEFRDGGEKKIEKTDTHIPNHMISLMSYSQRHQSILFFFKRGCEPLCWLKVCREAAERLVWLSGGSLDIASDPRPWWFVCQRVTRAHIVSAFCIIKFEEITYCVLLNPSYQLP